MHVDGDHLRGAGAADRRAAPGGRRPATARIWRNGGRQASCADVPAARLQVLSSRLAGGPHGSTCSAESAPATASSRSTRTSRTSTSRPSDRRPAAAARPEARSEHVRRHRPLRDRPPPPAAAAVLTAGLLLLLTFGAVSSDSVQIGGAVGQVHRNAPFVIVQFLTVMSVLGVFIATAFVASSILRDFERGTHELFFSKPVRPRDYLLGRFVGSMLASLLVFVGPVLGIVAGSFAPWVDPQRLGPLSLRRTSSRWASWSSPTCSSSAPPSSPSPGSPAACSPPSSASSPPWSATSSPGSGSRTWSSQSLAALARPVRDRPLQSATRYWTVVERNAALPDLAGALLANRLLWLGVGAALLGLVVWRFSYARAAGGGRRRSPAGGGRALERGPGAPLAAPLAEVGRGRPGTSARRPGGPCSSSAAGSRWRRCCAACRSWSCSPSASSTSSSRAASPTAFPAPASCR